MGTLLVAAATPNITFLPRNRSENRRPSAAPGICRTTKTTIKTTPNSWMLESHLIPEWVSKRETQTKITWIEFSNSQHREYSTRGEPTTPREEFVWTKMISRNLSRYCSRCCLHIHIPCPRYLFRIFRCENGNKRMDRMKHKQANKQSHAILLQWFFRRDGRNDSINQLLLWGWHATCNFYPPVGRKEGINVDPVRSERVWSSQSITPWWEWES